ncbi:MAG: hypothetical protein Q8P78_01240 [bacterium]|nr:hypothetical protein [bacterium]
MVRIALWGGSVALLGWLFLQNLVPTGEFVLEYKKGSGVSKISDLHQDKRVIDADGGNQSFYIDQVYFDARVPREFDTVAVDMAFQNKAQPILELGARKLRGSWGFVMKPLQNKIIDELDWPCQRYDEVLFCQRSEQYENLSEFLARPPASSIITYRYALPEGINHDVMNVNTNMDAYDFLAATYAVPESLGDDWHRKTVLYNWEDFAVHINEISFLLSAPELNRGRGQIVLGDITITLKRDPLDWDGFVSYVANQFNRLKT